MRRWLTHWGEQVDMQLVSSLRISLEALQPHASADAVPANLNAILEAPALHESLDALALHTLADEVLSSALSHHTTPHPLPSVTPHSPPFCHTTPATVMLLRPLATCVSSVITHAPSMFPDVHVHGVILPQPCNGRQLDVMSTFPSCLIDNLSLLLETHTKTHKHMHVVIACTHTYFGARILVW